MDTRRSLLLVLTVVLTAATPLVAVGCATTTPAAAPTEAVATPTESAAEATAPAVETVLPTPAAAQQGERLVIAVEHWGREIPFGWLNSVGEWRLWQPVFDPLIQVSMEAATDYQPGLFTEWSHSDDYKTWTFKVREGVMFHEDWGELTSEDVKWSLEQNLREDATGAQAARLFQAFLEDIETPDEYTVVMHWNREMWELLDEFAPFFSCQTIASKKYIEEVGEEAALLHPIGTGPYRHVEGVPGEYHIFEAVPNHWRVTPGFKELEVRAVPDSATRMSGLRSGQFDIVMVAGDSVAEAEDAGFRIVDWPGVMTYNVALPGLTNPQYPDSYCPECPWVGDPSDPQSLENALKVRMALNLAVDKQAIIDAFWHGYGDQTPFSYYYYPIAPGWSDEWVIPPYDAGRAKELLAEAGYADGFEIPALLANQAADGREIMEAVAQDWEAIGITVTRERVEVLDLLPQWIACSWTGSWVSAYPMPIPNPGVGWMDNLGVGWTWCGLIKHDDVEQKVKDIMAELDEEKRVEMMHAVGQELYEGYYGVPIGIKAVTFAVSDKVGNWDPPAPNMYSLWPEYAEWSGR